MNATNLPGPIVHPERDHLAHLAAGNFMLQRSRLTGNYIYYPRVAEPVTGSFDLEWVPASGKGVVYSVTIVRKRPPEKDYNVVLVDLAEGPRMMSRVDGLPLDQVRIGMAVTARIVNEEGRNIVVFVPASEGQ